MIQETLLRDAQFLNEVRRSSFLSGEMNVSLEKILERKNMVVEGSRAWIQNVLAGRGVSIIRGQGSFEGPKTLRVEHEGAASLFSAENIILAAGSVEEHPEGLAPNGRNIWSTDDALSFEKTPENLAIIGGGARGVEFAQIFRSLGVKVALFEQERRLLPRLDRGLTGRYRRMLVEDKIKVILKTRVVSVRENDQGGLNLTYHKDGREKEALVETVLTTASRRPDYRNLNLEAAGLSAPGGIIPTDAAGRTDVPGVYVIGDAAGPPYWAHKAISQARTAVRRLTGRTNEARATCIPACVYGDPEIGSVGLTEQEAKKSGRRVKIGEFHYVGNGRAGTLGSPRGLCRLLADADTDEVLGVHILGAGATEMVSLAAVSMENGLGLEAIRKTVFSHPSLAETFYEAALAADGQAVHLMIDGLEHDRDEG